VLSRDKKNASAFSLARFSNPSTPNKTHRLEVALMAARSKAELPPSSWRLNPGYEIFLEPVSARRRVELGGEIVAESENAQLMYELGHAPVYYFRRQNLRRDPLTPSAHHTHCPYKGDAGYFSVSAGELTAQNCVWY
jgi:uncharacterized protein (DUF427 family)